MHPLKKSKSFFILSLFTISFLFVSPLQLLGADAESTALLEKANHLYYMKNDAESSAPYYFQATQKGNILAKAQLAKMMYLGAGTSKNTPKAQQWFTEVIPHLQKAAEDGDPFGQYLWGYYFDNGFNGSPSVSDAVYWYQKAADQGCAAAQNNLGSNYSKGEGVSQDYTKAVYWYRKAAEQGNVVAQNNLAVKYDKGVGVSQDYTQAMFWYKKAADQGYAAAHYNLGLMCENGNGCADQSKWYGPYMIGRSNTTDKDLALALVWYHTAVKSGDTSAQKQIDTLMNSNKTSCQISDYNIGQRAMQIARQITDNIEDTLDDGCKYYDKYDVEFGLDNLAFREYIQDGKHELLVRFARRQFLLLSKSCPNSRGLDKISKEKYDASSRDIEEAYQLLSKSRDCAEKLQQAYKRISGTTCKNNN